MSALELIGVSKEHPGSPPVAALRSVTVTIGTGEFTAIVGPSGSGKSTMLAIAGTLERPTAGSVRVAGLAVDGLPDKALSGGGYGLEVVEPSGVHQLVGVTAGLFASGQVQVSGAGVAAGTRVVVAQ